MSVVVGVLMAVGLTISITPLVLVNEATGFDPSFSMGDFGIVAAAYCVAGSSEESQSGFCGLSPPWRYRAWS